MLIKKYYKRQNVKTNINILQKQINETNKKLSILAEIDPVLLLVSRRSLVLYRIRDTWWRFP
jgi:GGDEF domain-containing protein